MFFDKLKLELCLSQIFLATPQESLSWPPAKAGYQVPRVVLLKSPNWPSDDGDVGTVAFHGRSGSNEKAAGETWMVKLTGGRWDPWRGVDEWYLSWRQPLPFRAPSHHHLNVSCRLHDNICFHRRDTVLHHCQRCVAFCSHSRTHALISPAHTAGE